MSPPDNKLIQTPSMVKAVLELPSVYSVITGCNLAPFSVLPIFFFEILQGQNIGSSLYIVIFIKDGIKFIL